MVIETILGILSGGVGSWMSKAIGIYEKKQTFDHEIRLMEMQMKAKQSETENELAITQEESIGALRTASYEHDIASGKTSLWVNNTLRMVRPVLTVFLIFLVGAIWFTVGKEDVSLRYQIVEGVLFMASAALAWWFGARDHQRNAKLPWQ